MNPMKILFIAGHDHKYGTFQMAVKLLQYIQMIDSGIQFILITQAYGALNEWCRSNHIENYVIQYKYCVYFPEKNKLKCVIKYILKYIYVSFCNYFAIKKIEKLGLINDIDIIHTNFNRDLLGDMLSKKYHIPNITYLREFSKAHFHLQPLYAHQIDFMNRHCIRFIAVSNVVKKDWIEYGLDGSKISVVYDGIDTAKYKLKNIIKDDDSLKIVMCASIYKGKGQLEMAMAVEPLIKAGYNIFLDFYGTATNDAYYQRLLDYVAAKGLSKRISFKGYSKNLPQQLNEYDVGAICSNAEGFGIVTIEYLISGLVVVASNTGANPELLNNGEFGYLYPLSDINKLSEIIADIYITKSQKKSLRIKAAEYARENFSIEKTARSVIEVYSAVLRQQNDAN